MAADHTMGRVAVYKKETWLERLGILSIIVFKRLLRLTLTTQLRRYITLPWRLFIYQHGWHDLECLEFSQDRNAASFVHVFFIIISRSLRVGNFKKNSQSLPLTVNLIKNNCACDDGQNHRRMISSQFWLKMAFRIEKTITESSPQLLHP